MNYAYTTLIDEIMLWQWSIMKVTRYAVQASFQFPMTSRENRHEQKCLYLNNLELSAEYALFPRKLEC